MRNSFASPSASRGKVFRNSRYGGNSRPKRQGQFIHPDKFINKAVAAVEEIPFIPQHTFNDFGLTQSLQQTLTSRGYTHPTPIQDGSIKPALSGRDIIGLANTGTGKTAAFVLPIIHQLQVANGRGMVLIMVPTRELATQIDEEFKIFARGLNLYSALCVGGASLQRQIAQLSRRPQVIIGTPGRLKDLSNQGFLKLGFVTVLVLDEADRMFDMGFIRDIRFLVDLLPAKRQSLCFSATMPPEIKQLVNQVLTDPVTISVIKGQTSDHVEQDVVKVISKEHKLEILGQMLKQSDFEKVLVFGQTKFGVQRLADSLNRQGIRTEAIHGNKSQPQRQRALQAFKAGQVQVLVATDVAARGLDIPNVSHVINFDQPNTYDDYVHRIGRTGRAGKRGKALTFVS